LPTEVLVVADDLTGALDVAGPFASRGHATWVAVDPTACAAEQFADADVLSINVTSRHLPAERAAALVFETAGRLCPAHPAIVIKKIDSTLRGNVAAETLALVEATGRRNVIVVPAFPAQGRTVRRGVVHVKDQPLAQTAFARDALSPPPLEPLDAIFRDAAPHARVSLVGPDGPFDLALRNHSRGDDALAIFVVDTETDSDLDRTVRALKDRLDACVLVGSAGIAGAVARECLAPRERPIPPRLRGEMVFAIGSRAEQSAAQAAALADRADVAVLPAPNGKLDLLRAFTVPQPLLVIRATAGEDGREGDAQCVADTLARAIVEVLRRRPVRALLATGGDTAIAILHALSCAHLQVYGDVLPGIPHSRLQFDGREISLFTKAGGFGSPRTLLDLVELLQSD